MPIELLASALGVFAIGTTVFVNVGLLPLSQSVLAPTCHQVASSSRTSARSTRRGLAALVLLVVPALTQLGGALHRRSGTPTRARGSALAGR